MSPIKYSSLLTAFKLQDAYRLAEMAEGILQSTPIPANEVQELSLVLPQGERCAVS